MLLNRTNLTLSALALSNGLNLGTRPRAAHADVNLDGQTSYILLSHHVVMREGMEWSFVFSKPKSKQAIPSIPSSISPVQLPQLSCAISQQGGCAVDVRVEADPRPADLVGRREPRLVDRVTRFLTVVPTERTTTERSLYCQARTWSRASGSPGFYRTARRATTCSATARATTVGK
jgi:hypothetical protein